MLRNRWWRAWKLCRHWGLLSSSPSTGLTCESRRLGLLPNKRKPPRSPIAWTWTRRSMDVCPRWHTCLQLLLCYQKLLRVDVLTQSASVHAHVDGRRSFTDGQSSFRVALLRGDCWWENGGVVIHQVDKEYCHESRSKSDRERYCRSQKTARLTSGVTVLDR